MVCGQNDSDQGAHHRHLQWNNAIIIINIKQAPKQQP